MKEIVVTTELLNTIKDIPWFNDCGKVRNLELPFDFQYVKDWEEAEAYDEKEEWEEIITNSREALADFVMKKLGYSVRVFNSIVATVRDSAEYSLSVEKLRAIVEENNIKDEFGDTLSWILLNAGIEDAFKEFKGCPTFFREMLEVFKNGHCPCGWEGRWPKGKLFIY
ncbi:hypothetical protein [Paenibacillus sp. KS-LC4]|uniref:hypothetical protein n=1 Tax=Paenibacillus sp. KS-LC4 TaxID=2979727 RepID=UPI0030D0EF51